MNSDDEIWLLKRKLREAIQCIEFMHSCLTEPGYRYAHPHMTIDTLDGLRTLALPERTSFCVHSNLRKNPDCVSCQDTIAYLSRMAELEANYPDHPYFQLRQQRIKEWERRNGIS